MKFLEAREKHYAAYNFIMHREENINKRGLSRYFHVFRHDYYAHSLSEISVLGATETFPFTKFDS